MTTASPATAAPPSPLELLLELIRRARSAEDLATLRFLAVNDSHLLAPFQQSALWFADDGVAALSGLSDVEANAPFVQWLERLCTHLAATPGPRILRAADLAADLARDWTTWLPDHALWIPFGKTDTSGPAGGLLVVRELAWREFELKLFAEWIPTWFVACRALSHPGLVATTMRALRRAPRTVARRPLLWTLAICAIAFCPVRLSVLAPGELVPADPLAIRAPFEGVIKTVFVHTNEPVKKDQPLFAYDDAALASKLDVAVEAFHTARAEERQYNQQALTDAHARAALATAKGNVEEKRLDMEFLRQQLARSVVTAPRDGLAFIDDPADWIGRPVVTGQRVLRLAEPQDVAIEAWLPIADAIDLRAGAPVRLYLSSDPLTPVAGAIQQVAYEAARRPDGAYAYCVRATLDGATSHRVGLKGTARLTGRRVPLVYWALRRPLAAARQFLGL